MASSASSSTEIIEPMPREHTGLIFPSGRCWHDLDSSDLPLESISPTAAIFLSATLELLTSELLQLAGNEAKKSNKRRIDPQSIQLAIQNDAELSTLYRQQTEQSKARLSSPSSPIPIMATELQRSNNQEDQTEDDVAKLDQARSSHKIFPKKTKKSSAKISLSLNPFGVSIENTESPNALARLSVPSTPPNCTNYQVKYEQAAIRKPKTFWNDFEEKETEKEELTLLNYGNFPSETRETDDENVESSDEEEDDLLDIGLDEAMLNEIMNEEGSDDNNVLNDDSFISGLYYCENYLSNAEHDALVQFVNNNEWNKVSSRLVQEYGFSYDECSYSLTKITKHPFDKIPSIFAKILKKIGNDDRFGMNGKCADDFDQCVVDFLPSFGGLPYCVHSRECFEEYVIGISLGNEAVINFRHVETKEIKQLLARPKSIWILSGDARRNWEQGIEETDIHFYNGQRIMRQHRISLTFRKCLHLETINAQQDETKDYMFLNKIDSLLDIMDGFMQ